MDMRGYISSKLRELSSAQEGAYLREVMEEVFLPMYDESKQKYQALEARVIDSFPFHTKNFVIIGTIMEKDRIGYDCPWLVPMAKEDLQEQDEDLDELVTDDPLILETVCLLDNYKVCHELAKSHRKFRGTAKTKNGDFPIVIKLQPTEKYVQVIERIYHAFIDNGIQWVTPNLPYLHKFFDVVCINAKEFGLKGPINEWSVDFGEFETKLIHNVVPVWNVEPINIDGQVVPRPVLDELAYEYYIELQDDDMQNGFLADYSSGSILDIRREQQGVIITSTANQGTTWKLYQFYQQEATQTMKFDYPLHSNRQEESFCGRLTSYYQSKIKTKAELIRLVHSYDAAKEIRLECFYLTSAHENGEGYELNAFILDEIRDKNASKRLVLQFKPIKANNALNYDLMSFLTAQVQLIYPEYYCVGVLL